jgi:hypothetical protein
LANITLQGKNVSIKASDAIKFEASGNSAIINSTSISTAGNINANTVYALLDGAQAGSGAGKSASRSVTVAPIQKPELPKKIEPSDRGKIHYKPEECPIKEIQHDKPVAPPPPPLPTPPPPDITNIA